MACSALDALIHAPIDKMIAHVAELPRPDAKQLLLSFGPLRLDFTSEYLDTLGIDQLRHVLVAALFQAKRAVEASRLAAAG